MLRILKNLKEKKELEVLRAENVELKNRLKEQEDAIVELAEIIAGGVE